MVMATKREVLKAHLASWLEAKDDGKRRGEIIRLISSAIHLYPKSIPQAFKRLQLKTEGGTRRPGRPRLYGNDVIAALVDVWNVGDRCCGELLASVDQGIRRLPEEERDMEPRGSRDEHPLFHESDRRETIRLRSSEEAWNERGISSTKPSSLKFIIPVFKGPGKDLPPGNGQIDTVAHCGDTLLGDFIFTLNYTDSATMWTIQRAQWNKEQDAIVKSLDRIQCHLPFDLLMVHPDTGSEFINRNMKSWCDERWISMTRSEPGKKNDNMYVEERNGHVVRRYLGYMRLDVLEIVPVINELYDVLGTYLNHFKAVRRQVARERIGSKIKRRYEVKAMTPYQRVMERSDVSEEIKRRLREEHAFLDPLKLLKEIDTLKMKIYFIQKTARERKGALS
jgi:hypothetical protein